MRGRTKIEILNQEQQEGVRKVCRLAREVLDIAAAAAVPGVTTDYVDEVVHKACLEREVRIFSCYLINFLTKAVLSITSELLQLSEICVHVRERSYLPWYS